jgi:hypothetical protein
MGAFMPDINKVKNSLKQCFKMFNLGTYYFYLKMKVVYNCLYYTFKLS